MPPRLLEPWHQPLPCSYHLDRIAVECCCLASSLFSAEDAELCGSTIDLLLKRKPYTYMLTYELTLLSIDWAHRPVCSIRQLCISVRMGYTGRHDYHSCSSNGIFREGHDGTDWRSCCIYISHAAVTVQVCGWSCAAGCTGLVILYAFKLARSMSLLPCLA